MPNLLTLIYKETAHSFLISAWYGV